MPAKNGSWKPIANIDRNSAIRAIEPYCVTACKIFGVPDGTYTKDYTAKRKVGKTCDLAFGYMGGLGAWRNFEPDRFSDEEVETFKNEWRAAHPTDRAVLVRHRQRRREGGSRARRRFPSAARSIFKSDGKFLQIELPSGRKLSYPNPRLILDGRDQARVVYDDNSGGRFAPCRGGYGAYGGIWFENIVSGIARDILVEAMFRIEAAGYPIVMHVHDEVVAEVPLGFGSEEQFLKLMTQQPSWAPDLPIAASAWSGHRYDKHGQACDRLDARPPITVTTPSIPPIETIIMEDMTEDAPAAAARQSVSSPSPSPLTSPLMIPPTSLVSSRRALRGTSPAPDFRSFTSSAPTARSSSPAAPKCRGEIRDRHDQRPPIRASVLTEIGSKIDIMNYREAIGIGVVKGDLPLSGDITTKEKYKKCQGNPRSSLANAIPRRQSHFGWPPDGSSACCSSTATRRTACMRS